MGIRELHYHLSVPETRVGKALKSEMQVMKDKRRVNTKTLTLQIPPPQPHNLATKKYGQKKPRY